MTFSHALAAFCLSAFLIPPTFAAATQIESAAPTVHDEKIVLGRIERVYLSGIAAFKNVGIPGKIDTGADTTSIHAEQIHIRSKNPKFSALEGEALLKAIAEAFGEPGEEWWLTEFDTPERNLQTSVSFNLRHPYSGEVISIERPLSRISAIQARGENSYHYRPVIELDLTIAGKTVHTEVNLADRSGFSYAILIGKTFLRDNAWVDAGVDYLNEESGARIIGTKEQAHIEGLTMETTVSFANRYSVLHAKEVSIDQDNQRVTFTLEDKQQQRKTLTRPLKRILTVSGEEYPLVYLPLQLGQAPGEFNQPVLVYLKDRSAQNSQLHLGTETLSQYFLIDLAGEQLGSKPLQTLSERQQSGPTRLLSTQENFTLNGISLLASPSTLINTSLLQAASVNELAGKDETNVQVTFKEPHLEPKVFSAPILRKIKVGDEVRPIIEAQLEASSIALTGEVAVVERVLELDEPQLLIGPNLTTEPLLISTRSERLLNKKAPRKVGYIEQLELEGISIPVKLDTGADLNSLHATAIERFEEEGKEMVRFTFDHSGIEQTFTRKVIGEMKIRARAGEASKPRPIVMMQVGRGDVQIQIPVNLQDRSAFNYGMILGKTFLANSFWVSSDQPYLFTEQPPAQ